MLGLLLAMAMAQADLPDATKLAEAFNAAKGKARIVMLVSPTCGACVEGADVIREEVLARLNDKRLAAFCVFVPMVKDDSRGAASEAAGRLKEAGVVSYWDGERELARAIARVVALPKGNTTAWDVYFVYDAGTDWGEAPPAPKFWMHQLAEDERLLDGEKFRAAVQKELDAMIPTKHLVLLTRKGCSGTATMRANLDQALKELAGWDYEVADLGELPQGDPRKGYPTPTLLHDGKDVYGLPAPEPGSDSPG
jgi:hypothetical protein